MLDPVRLLKEIMRTSGWSQEQLALKLGVSFASLNGWVNGRTKPRKAMLARIHKLYLAQDITNDINPTYVTLVNVGYDLRVGDVVLLTKDTHNGRDDEAIEASVLEINDLSRDENMEIDESEDDGYSEREKDGESDGADGWVEYYGDGRNMDELGKKVDTDCIEMSMYVANSVNSVVRGTSSAGRVYDRFEKNARAQVLFVFHRMAIAKVVEWNYEV